MHNTKSVNNTPIDKPLVRFYVYPQEVSEAQRLDFVCLLAQKAQSEHKRVSVLCADDRQANLLDEQLWAFNSVSFIPHCFAGEALAPRASVILSIAPERLVSADVVINLSLEPRAELPKGSERVFEIVNQTPDVLRVTRQRFHGYKTLGLTPQTHSLATTIKH